jgi:hypothetical protein
LTGQTQLSLQELDFDTREDNDHNAIRLRKKKDEDVSSVIFFLDAPTFSVTLLQ